MPSRSWANWNRASRKALDDIEKAHRAVGGIARGRRYATGRINEAYLLAVASQFQLYCRNVYIEAVDFTVSQLPPATPPTIKHVLSQNLAFGQALKNKNAQPSSLGQDFNRLGFNFWQEMANYHPANKGLQKNLEELNTWRNAFAHQDFSQTAGLSTIQLSKVKAFRRVCERLAKNTDWVIGRQVRNLTGNSPW